MAKMLKIENVSKSYMHNGRELAVLKDINLEIADGEFVCIVGPSGCGKTTLLNMAAGLDHDYKGNILHKGKPVGTPGPDRLLIFQDLGLFPWLTVQKNVEFGLKLKKLPPGERARLAGEALNMVQLGRFKDLYIHQLSGGMKQRVALARALVLDPEILLMDEPFTALDAQTRDNLHDELQKIWSKTKKTVIFVTHNVREAVCLGDRVVVLSAQPGTVKASFPVDLPRPRRIEDNGLMQHVRQVLAELKFEIDKQFQEEYETKETA